MAAEEGAQLLLIARNEEALRQLAEEINNRGGRAIYRAADVADENALREAAQMAIKEFGRIDTWVNDAGTAIYGRFNDVPEQDARRLFDTNFWGVVNGSRVAVECLQDRGGALINLGSEVSDTPVPLLGIYAASKHAVKGFTDTLRMELESDNKPISVTLIKPTATHTPFPENAKNFMPFEPKLPAPVYSPDLVAEAILFCSENPVRDFFVGDMAVVNSTMGRYMPRLHDKLMERTAESMQNSGEPSVINRRDGLHQTNSRLSERGSMDRFVMETSLYQQAKIHPMLAKALFLGGGMALATMIGTRLTRAKRPMTGTRRFGRQDQWKVRGNFENKEIREHMEVVGADGGHVGTVDHVEGQELKLTKNDPEAQGSHHRIPMNLVDSVSGDRVVLTKPAREAKANWQSA